MVCLNDFHIILDMHSLTFEQANYLWSTLGGKQHPFVCYKVRLIRLQREAVRENPRCHQRNQDR